MHEEIRLKSSSVSLKELGNHKVSLDSLAETGKGSKFKNGF
jgi:hypothetical protein